MTYSNPFLFYLNDFDPDHIHSHKHDLLSIIHTICGVDPHTVNVVGTRWIGKTPLLKFIAYADINLPEFDVALSNFQREYIHRFYFEVDSSADALNTLANIADTIRNYLVEKRMLPISKQLDDGMFWDEPISEIKPGNIPLFLQNLIQSIAERRHRVILCLDDVDLSLFEDRNILRSFTELQNHASIILASRQNLSEQYVNSTQSPLVGSPFAGKIRVKYLRLLTYDTAVEILRTTTKGQIRFSEEEIDSLIKFVGLHPHFLINGAAEAYDYKLGTKRQITENIIRLEIASIFNAEFEYLWLNYAKEINVFEQLREKNENNAIATQHGLMLQKKNILHRSELDTGDVYFSRLFEIFLKDKLASLTPLISHVEAESESMQLAVNIGIDPTTKEGQLFQMLLTNKGTVIPDEMAIQTLWPDQPDPKHALRTTVNRLREKIKNIDLDIKRLRSVGYLIQ